MANENSESTIDYRGYLKGPFPQTLTAKQWLVGMILSGITANSDKSGIFGKEEYVDFAFKMADMVLERGA